VQIDLRAKGAVIPSHQLAYVGVPLDSSDIRMNQPRPPCLATSRRKSPYFPAICDEQLTSPRISDVNHDYV
jgi:hypothetical protein